MEPDLTVLVIVIVVVACYCQVIAHSKTYYVIDIFDVRCYGVVCRIVSGHQLIVEFHANKEKLMKEKITLRSATGDNVLFLIFQARVLGECLRIECSWTHA